MPKKTKVGNCAYCGELAELSEDHVVPECFWEKPLPADVPKVWACKRCNQEIKSFDDTFLRDLFALDGRTASRAISQTNYEKYKRAASRGQSALGPAEAQARPVFRQNQAGIYVPSGSAIAIPKMRLRRALAMVVRGLYFYYLKERLPNQSRYATREVTEAEMLEHVIPFVEQNAGKEGLSYVPVDNGSTFSCLFGIPEDTPSTSLWYLTFYEQVMFIVATNWLIWDYRETYPFTRKKRIL